MGAALVPILSTVAGGLASTVLGKVLAPKAPKAPKTPDAVAPTPEPVAVMPDAKAPTMDAARKKSLVEQANRKGRASTILTDNSSDSSDKLGGG